MGTSSYRHPKDADVVQLSAMKWTVALAILAILAVPPPLPADADERGEQKTDFVALFGTIAQVVSSTVAIIVVVTR